MRATSILFCKTVRIPTVSDLLSCAFFIRFARRTFREGCNYLFLADLGSTLNAVGRHSLGKRPMQTHAVLPRRGVASARPTKARVPKPLEDLPKAV